MIEVRQLTKSFGNKRAVDGISFQVAKGEVLGFLGPNGAGKSTTMRIIAGYLPASSGTVTVGGKDVSLDPLGVKRQIGYLPENAPSYAEMDVTGFLKFAAEIRGLRGSSASKAVDTAIDLCFLSSVRRQSIETLSKGYRHRVGLAQAVIHDPPVLILDEPTDGLDPNQKHEVRSLIRHMGETKAIIFSTHILEEVEAACSRAMIIHNGRIVASGTPNELKARSKKAGLITLRLAKGDPDLLHKALSPLADSIECLPGTAFRLRPKSGTTTATLAELAVRERWLLTELSIEEGRLDEVFREITSQQREKEKP
jgi:ABC-2 type transport system ATP-binding protein